MSDQPILSQIDPALDYGGRTWGLRLIAGVSFAAAAGAVIAAGVLSLGGMSGWARGLAATAAAFGATLGAGSIGMALLMPTTAKLIRPAPRNQSMPVSAVALFTAFLILAISQVPSVAAWWTRNLQLAQELLPSGPDPLGLNLIPTTLLVFGPVLAAAALAAVVLACLLPFSVPLDLVTRVMTACAFLQGGLVGALLVGSRGMHEITVAAQQLVDRANDPVMSARVAEWITRYDASAGVAARIPWLFLGYLLLFAMVWSTLRESPAAETASAPVPTPASVPVNTSSARLSASPSDFDYSSYATRPRGSWLAVFNWNPSEYEITSIPPMSTSRFSLSWTRGAVRREPNGPDILSVHASRDGGLFGSQSYVVSDARTGSPIGTLVPNGFDWEMRDPAGQVIAHVLEIERGADRSRYAAKTGDQEIARFVWGMLGFTVQSAELQTEFLPGTVGDARALAIVLSPILEQRARHTSQRSS